MNDADKIIHRRNGHLDAARLLNELLTQTTDPAARQMLREAVRRLAKLSAEVAERIAK